MQSSTSPMYAVGSKRATTLPLHDIAFAVDDEFREIPLDVRLLVPFGILLGEFLFQQVLERVFVESLKALLGFQVVIQRQGVLAVDVRLLHLLVGRLVVQGAERVDFLIRSRCLPAELVARDVQNLKALVVVVIVPLGQFGILRRESATGRRVHNQDNLSLVVREVDDIATFLGY